MSTKRRRSAKHRAGLSIRLAEEKAKAAMARAAGARRLGAMSSFSPPTRSWALAAAFCPRPKPKRRPTTACALLSGRSHWVYSTVCLIAPDGAQDHALLSKPRCASSACRAKTSKAISSRDEWRGKAGGYAIQGRAEAFVRNLTGSYSGVIGLPLYETVHLLQGAGYPVFTAG